MHKTKFCNFRPFVIFAIVAICSIIATIFLLVDQFSKITVIIFLFCIAIITLCVFFVSKIKSILIISICLFISCIPITTILFKAEKINNYSQYENKDVFVLGRICENYHFSKNNYLMITLSDVEINSNDNYIDGKITLYLNAHLLDLSNFEIGKYVLAKTNLNFYTLNSENRYELSYLSKNVVASGWANYYEITFFDESDKTISENFRQNVLNLLESSDMKNADIAYAMIFGESYSVGNEVTEIYRETGIAHLLAVSGLHVSAIVFFISFILKKLRCPQLLQLILLCILLPFYCYLCNFSISVIRATAMAVLLNYSYIRGKPYDRLSVLAMIAFIILIISPLQIFNLSFLLSFSAVLSIILLAPKLTQLFKHIFYDKLAETFGVLFAIQFGLSAINIYYFNKIQPLSFLSNFVSIPISTCSFVLLLVSICVTKIFARLNITLKFVGELFDIVSKFNNLIKNLNLTKTISVISFNFAPLLFLIMFIISDYCLWNKKLKYCLSVPILTLFLMFLLIL